MDGTENHATPPSPQAVIARLREVVEKVKDAASFRVFTPKGKKVKLKRAIPAGATVKFTTEDGRTAVEFEEGKPTESGMT